jgi:hypothetical protein
MKDKTFIVETVNPPGPITPDDLLQMVKENIRVHIAKPG